MSEPSTGDVIAVVFPLCVCVVVWSVLPSGATCERYSIYGHLIR